MTPTAPNTTDNRMASSTALSNAGEFCRACRGKGGGYDSNGHGGQVFVPCYYCEGSGDQTVRMSAQPSSTSKLGGMV